MNHFLFFLGYLIVILALIFNIIYQESFVHESLMGIAVMLHQIYFNRNKNE